MRIKKGYKIRQIAGENIIIAAGEKETDLTKIISLNPTSCFLWENLAVKDFTEQDIVDLLIREYKIDHQTAAKDVKSWLHALSECGIIE
ncbi:MAG: PqqD family protein [Bacteroidales bacterium]